jgi:hypothetical protein
MDGGSDVGSRKQHSRRPCQGHRRCVRAPYVAMISLHLVVTSSWQNGGLLERITKRSPRVQHAHPSAMMNDS